MQRTYGGTKRKQKRTSGFRARMATSKGRCTINARRRKGRKRLAVQLEDEELGMFGQRPRACPNNQG